MYAEVILSQRFPKSLGVFDYVVPPSFSDRITVGQMVRIPFRKSVVDGVVVKLKDSPVAGKHIRPLLDIVEISPVLTHLQLELAEWISQHYFVSVGTVIKMMLPEIPKRASLHTPEATQPWREIPHNAGPQISQKKNQLVWSKELAATYAWLRTTLSELSDGQTVILTPEISYIPALLQLLPGTLREQTVVFHSRMKIGESYEAWSRVKSGSTSLVIGTKLAILLPFSRLSHILIDREEDDDHKNYDQNPRFDARTVAEFVAKASGASITYLSSAPRVELFSRHTQDNSEILRLGSPLRRTPVVVNMEEERKKRNFSLLSDSLSDEIRSVLAQKGKVFLFLNRRGSASAVYCKDCGKLQSCVSCGHPLSVHALPHQAKLKCHVCQTSQELVACSRCGSVRFRYSLPGTQKLEQELQAVFPRVSILRVDRDQPNTSSASITVGTEYAVRRITMSTFRLVAVINADTMIETPDYRSAEWALQRLSSLMASMDRSALFIVQTSHPKQQVFLVCASQETYPWYLHELEERKGLRYPPFITLVKLMKDFTREQSATEESQRLVRLFTPPVVAFALRSLLSRRKGHIRCTVVVKCPQSTSDNALRTIFRDVPDSWIIDRDPVSLV